MAKLKASPVAPPPPQYTAEERGVMIEHILGEVAGGRSVSSILDQDADMPSSTTFWRWHMHDEVLRENLARSRDNGIEALMEKARHIAETPMIGEEITIEKGDEDDEDGDVVKVKRADMLGHRKLMIDTIHKQAQMLKPKTYGPKLDLTSGGERLALSAELEAARKRAAEANE